MASFPLSVLVSDKCDIKPISHVVTKEATKLFMLYVHATIKESESNPTGMVQFYCNTFTLFAMCELIIFQMQNDPK